jgi:hypothetical protein
MALRTRPTRCSPTLPVTSVAAPGRRGRALTDDDLNLPRRQSRGARMMGAVPRVSRGSERSRRGPKHGRCVGVGAPASGAAVEPLAHGAMCPGRGGGAATTLAPAFQPPSVRCKWVAVREGSHRRQEPPCTRILQLYSRRRHLLLCHSLDLNDRRPRRLRAIKRGCGSFDKDQSTGATCSSPAQHMPLACGAQVMKLAIPTLTAVYLPLAAAHSSLISP